MADSIRDLMERMVPEVQYLEDRGYFSKAEVRALIQARLDFEYKLRAKAPDKEAFWRYIAYEKSLQELKQLRKAALPAQQTDTTLERAILRRVHFVYERATRRFKGELRLWNSWLDFCMATEASRRFSKVAARALQLHPTQAQLWIRAASWEFDQRASAAAARSLMQRALRICPHEALLWGEYFRMELLYAAKLHARRKVLGLVPAEDEAVAAVLNGEVARLVYRAAVKARPADLDLREKLLQVAAEVPLPAAAQLRQSILADLATDLSSSEDAWALRARAAEPAELASNAPSAVSGVQEASAPDARTQAGAALLEVGVQQLQTPAMWTLLGRHLHAAMDSLQAAPGPSDTTSAAKARRKAARRLAGQLAGVAQRALEAGKVSADLLELWVDAELARGRPEAALQACQAASKAVPSHAAFWSQQIAIAAQLGAAQQAPGDPERDELQQSLLSTLQQALAAVPDAVQQQPVWDQAFQAAEDLQLPALLDRLLPLLRAAALSSNVTAQVIERGLRATAELQGPAAMQHLLAGLQGRARLGEAVYLSVLDMQSTQAEPAILQSILEAAVQECGESSTALWLRYLAFQRQQGKGVGQVQWRASRALKDSSAFAAAAAVANTQH